MTAFPDPLPPGWYWRPLEPGLLPILTNTPPTMEYCVDHGGFVALVHMRPEQPICTDCYNRNQNPAYKRYVRDKEARAKKRSAA